MWIPDLSVFHLSCLQLPTVGSSLHLHCELLRYQRLLLLCPGPTTRLSFTTATLLVELSNEQQLSLHEQSQNVPTVDRLLFLIPHFMDREL